MAMFPYFCSNHCTIVVLRAEVFLFVRGQGKKPHTNEKMSARETSMIDPNFVLNYIL